MVGLRKLMKPREGVERTEGELVSNTVGLLSLQSH